MDQDEYGIVHKGVRNWSLQEAVSLFCPTAGALPAEQKNHLWEDPHPSAKTGKSRKHAIQEGLLLRAHLREYGDKGRCLTWFLWWELAGVSAVLPPCVGTSVCAV